MGKIRILLALSVLIGHMGGVFGMQLVAPPMAVELFFMISGFYMALILSEKYNSYYLFISNRILKIYPAYLFVLILTINLSFIYFLKTHNYENGLIGKIATSKIPPSSMFWLLLPNVTIIGQDLLFFLKVSAQYHLQFTTNFADSPVILIRFLAVPQAWSISLELMFYVIAPFLIRLRTRGLLLIAAVSLIIKVALYAYGLGFDPWSYRFFPAELVFFILGMVGYRLYRSELFSRMNRSFNISGSNIYYFALLLILLLYSSLIKNYILQILLVILFAFLLPFIFEKFKKNRIDKKIGDFSYELYICHELCIYSLSAILQKFSNHTEINKIIIIIVSLAFAYTISLLVTQKIDEFRQRRIKLKTYTPLSIIN